MTNFSTYRDCSLNLCLPEEVQIACHWWVTASLSCKILGFSSNQILVEGIHNKDSGMHLVMACLALGSRLRWTEEAGSSGGVLTDWEFRAEAEELAVEDLGL